MGKKYTYEPVLIDGRAPAPSRFEIVIGRDGENGMDFGAILMYSASSTGVFLQSVFATDIGVPATLDVLRSYHDLSWWARKAMLDVATQTYESVFSEAAEIIDPHHDMGSEEVEKMKAFFFDRHLDPIRKLPMTHRRRRVTDDLLKSVATTYRSALDRGENPTEAVFTAFENTERPVSRSTAGRWVMEARKRGFLGSATERKAGETDNDETQA